ncbi:Mechanosensitive ion channel-domain-containing protein [Tribonema minus]|uniref:Mechanosensitive ion channel-domain-containing protein n=1 Tax=Tribonema minus TaxID=303371 RepID=A0A835YNP7_9STRA|nr:Mechanosensitive ion channel-domain-containing protein [Tribonema minus]
MEQVFALFDRDDSNDITHEEVVNGVVNIYKDHQSLALTLQDSQRMAHKLGEVLGAGILIALIFIWLRIFGRDIFALTLTFASVLVGVSVLIGPASANLFASIVFIFVQRPFDVGDRVFHWFPDGRGEMQNAVVTRIDLLITCFRAWDEKVYYLPNHVLATRPIINIQRSGDQWHEFFIQVLASTPSQKLWELKAKCVEFAEKHNKPSGIHPHIQFALTGVENTNRLTIRVCFRQKGNWQILSRKWAVQSMCTNCIVNSCKELGITYTQPQLPLDFNKQKLF